MEVAGIEPASRDISMEASTCVVRFFVVIGCGPNEQGTHQTWMELF